MRLLEKSLNLKNKTMIKLVDLLKEEDVPKCPVATVNDDVHHKHRQFAIDQHGYGPENPNNPNVKFWTSKAAAWNMQFAEEAKQRRCNSCAAFNITSFISSCLERSNPTPEPEPEFTEKPTPTERSAPAEFNPKIREEQEVDNVEPESTEVDLDTKWDTTEAGKIGYCMMYKFKASGSRTCNSWKPGGPVKDK